MLKKYITLALFVSLLLISTNAMAQGGPTPCPDGSDPPCGGPPPPPGRPIDGGIGLLFALGAAYGIKKLRENK
ncbi:MAG: hypothetical protein HKN90_05745 [Flavobacteriaceae bacterium]|nr:hypothetical protein [Flavobacteriaceae bacterium]